MPSQDIFGPVPNELSLGLVILQSPLSPPKPVPVHPAGATPGFDPNVSVNTKVDPQEEQVTPTGAGGGVLKVVKFTGPIHTLNPSVLQFALTYTS